MSANDAVYVGQVGCFRDQGTVWIGILRYNARSTIICAQNGLFRTVIAWHTPKNRCKTRMILRQLTLIHINTNSIRTRDDSSGQASAKE